MASRNEIMEYRRKKIKKFMRMEEEEDVELFFVIIPALLQELNEEKIPEHTSEYIGAIKMEEILAGHMNWCRSEFRVEPHIFKEISNYLRREGLLRDTCRVRVEEQLGIFMFMLSHNASIGRLKNTFQHSGETIYRHLMAMFNIIPILTHGFLKLPSSMETHPRIASDYHFWPFFKNCIGAIDGTHVPITIAEEKAPPYRNRKDTLSQNIMLACDFNLNFTFISCSWEGSASDVGVLRSAITKGFHVPEGKFYLDVESIHSKSGMIIFVYQSMGKKERASWHHDYEKGFIEILQDHVHVPRFRGQNGWKSEGWNNITQKFNEKFPSGYDKLQLQDKGKDLKLSYNATPCMHCYIVSFQMVYSFITGQSYSEKVLQKGFPSILRHGKVM